MDQVYNQNIQWSVLWVYFGVCRQSDYNKYIRSISDMGNCREDQIEKIYKIEPQEIYFAGRMARNELNGNQWWTIRSVKYVKEVANNLEEWLKKKGIQLSTRAINPMSSDYRPKLNVTVEMDAHYITMIQ